MFQVEVANCQFRQNTNCIIKLSLCEIYFSTYCSWLLYSVSCEFNERNMLVVTDDKGEDSNY